MSRDLPERPWFLPETREIGGFAVVSVLRSAGKTLSLSVVDREGRPFAMKIPVKENASDPTWTGRFEREVQILRELVGPAFPELRAFGKYATEEHEEIPYLVTSAPIGPTLKEIIAQRRATAARPDVAGAPLLLRALAEALSEVHEKGFVHRNLRPDKIAVAGGRIQILDFILGLAGVVDDLTRANEFLGTPDYIAPEQIRSPHNVDARADLYSLGLILFEYLTYDRPFGQGTTGVEAFLRHVTQDAPPPSSINPEVPRDLDRLLLRLLQRERGERFQSAQEVIVAVDELLQARRGQALSHLCLMPETGRIGPYRVSEAIGTIGKTLQIRVEDGKGRPFAMKIPSRQGLQDEGYLLRFEREVGLLREVAGPSFPLLRASGTYEAGGHKHIPYMVTDLPAGKTLREIIDQRRQDNAPPDVEGAPLLLRRLALLLAEVHAKNIFPCNIRPDVVATREDGVQLLEFLLNQGATSDGVVASGGVSALASYAAPEQLEVGGRVDARADLYSLGVLLFEYLTYELPYGTSSSRHDALLRLMTQPASSPSSYAEGIPPALDALVVRLLARDPANRPASAQQLAEEVRSLLP
jgi:serine/threonine protein kinase